LGRGIGVMFAIPGAVVALRTIVPCPLSIVGILLPTLKITASIVMVLVFVILATVATLVEQHLQLQRAVPGQFPDESLAPTQQELLHFAFFHQHCHKDEQRLHQLLLLQQLPPPPWTNSGSVCPEAGTLQC
jgi:hypothetical protein